MASELEGPVNIGNPEYVTDEVDAQPLQLPGKLTERARSEDRSIGNDYRLSAAATNPGHQVRRIGNYGDQGAINLEVVGFAAGAGGNDVQAHVRKLAEMANECFRVAGRADDDRRLLAAACPPMPVQPLPSTPVERHLKESTDGLSDESSQAYVGVIDLLDDESIDLVLVDGIHRSGCAIRSLRKIRPGGMLVVDNADWFVPTSSHTPREHKLMLRNDVWERFERSVNDWRRINTTNGVWDTLMWIKPPK